MSESNVRRPRHSVRRAGGALAVLLALFTATAPGVRAAIDQTIIFPDLPGVTLDQAASAPAATASSSLPVTYSTLSGTCSVTGAGVITLLHAGDCVIDANQPGDATYNAALPVSKTLAIGLGNQTISFTGPTAKTLLDSPVAISATASSGIPVTFSSATPLVCSVSGTSVTLLATGACTLDADQAGNADWNAAPQVQQSFAVGTASPGSQTISFTSSAPASATVGGATYTATATATSGLPVALTIDATAGSVCSISAGVVSFIGAGTCLINANQAGNADWNAAPQVQQSFAVGTAVISPPGAPTSLTVTAEPKSRPFGTPNPAFTAVISGFVIGQTLATSGITGSPLCTTTATLFSPAGTYPITCGIGTLASVAHVFTFVPATLTIVHGASSVTLSTATTVFETTTPVTWTAAVEPEVSGALPTGNLVFDIDGIAQPAVPLDKNGRGSVTVRWSTPGRKSVVVSYAGDASFAATGTASTAPSVVANKARATGVGVSATSLSPIVDGWRDTVTARGTRLEPLSVAIVVKDAHGNAVRTFTSRTAAGPYAWAWNGRRSNGAALPAGRYTIVQSLSDPYGSRPHAVTTSSVVLSLREIKWSAITITATPGPRCFAFSSGDGVGPYSCSSTVPLRLAAAAGHWPGVGYEFRLPSATAYRSIRVEVVGTSTGRQPTVGFHDWTLGLAWGQLYRPDWRSTAISPTATRSAGVTTTDTARFISGRSVRVYIEGGGRLAGTFAFVVTGVRLLVSVATLQ
jgi:hypothetical protein